MRKDKLQDRHIGIRKADEQEMLDAIGVKSLDELIDKVMPKDIRLPEPLKLGKAMTEREYAEHISKLAAKNNIYTSLIGQGWYDTITPAVIQRNIFENPVWYTSYTPYQAEISQGRLEALMNFQTMVSDLTAMPLSNCSLLDEATAGAESATMMFNLRSRQQVKAGANVLFVDEKTFTQTLAVLNTRCIPQGMKIVTGSYKTFEFTPEVFGAIIQYPNSDGSIENYREFVERAHANGAKVAVAADIMSLVLLTPPGEWGADIVFGSTQRMGIPMFYGGPSAAYMATRDEYKRNLPGRIIGLSKDKYGKVCYRMALQTREQHIKREKATSNICTAQALLATMAGMYAVYHGKEGLVDIARRIHGHAAYINRILKQLGYEQLNEQFFDTLRIRLPQRMSSSQVKTIAQSKEINLCYYPNGDIGMSVDETTNENIVNTILTMFAVCAEMNYECTEEVKYCNVISEEFPDVGDFHGSSGFKRVCFSRKKEKQTACKPGSVTLQAGESVIYLRLASPSGSSGLPSDVGRATLLDAGLHDLTTPKMHSPYIAARLVGSYPAFSPLPPGPGGGCFLLHCSVLAGSFLLGSRMLCVARTFLFYQRYQRQTGRLLL